MQPFSEAHSQDYSPSLPSPVGESPTVTGGSPVLSTEVGHGHEISGMVLIELMVAIAILAIALLPLAYATSSTAKLFRANYERAVAMEIVDGEMEILAAGEWRAFPEGPQSYAVHAKAAANLPPGTFQFTRAGNHLRLEWSSTQKRGVGVVVREVTVP